jgi:hypothetical protein
MSQILVEKERKTMQPPRQLSSNLNNLSNQDLERPATAFLSYKHEDAEEVKHLQNQLNVRGVRAWRDVTDLPLGGSNVEEIVHAIEQESDAFVLYVTQQSLQSDFVWYTEVPTALSRWNADHSFKIIPVLYGVTFAELEQHCSAHNLRSLKEFNGVSLPLKESGASVEEYNRKLREIARLILEATLTLRLRRAGADRNYEPCLCFHTYHYDPPTNSLDLDVDWTGFFPSKDDLPAEKERDEVLLPALDDVKQALSMKTPSRRLQVFVQAHLPAAFALGAAFPESAHFILQVNARVEGRDDIWSTEGSTSIVEPFEPFFYQSEGDVSVAVMEIAIPTGIAGDVARNLKALGISFKHHIRFTVRGGPDYRAVKSSEQALAMSLQVGKEFRHLYGHWGVTHIHLFAAVPAALAVMIGHQINAMSAITLYHFLEKDRRYVPVCTLGKQKDMM